MYNWDYKYCLLSHVLLFLFECLSPNLVVNIISYDYLAKNCLSIRLVLRLQLLSSPHGFRNVTNSSLSLSDSFYPKHFSRTAWVLVLWSFTQVRSFWRWVLLASVRTYNINVKNVLCSSWLYNTYLYSSFYDSKFHCQVTSLFPRN